MDTQATGRKIPERGLADEIHVTLWVARGTTTKDVSEMLEKALPEHDIDCDYFSVR